MGNDEQRQSSEYTVAVGWTATEETVSIYFFIFLSLLAFTLVLCNKLHHSPKLYWFPEAGLIILVGLVVGGIFSIFDKGSSSGDGGDVDDGFYEDNEEEEEIIEGLLSFSPKVFFVGLLPPIIFNSGYHIKNELFMRHIVPIFLYACLGTAISTFAVALFLELAVELGLTGSFKPTVGELLTFGALISATDPVSTLAVFQQKRVDPQLFYLCFGESIMNDAVGLVLFNTFGKFVGHEENITKVTIAIAAFGLDFLYIFCGSLALGIFSGAIVGYLFKIVNMKDTPLLELSLYCLIVYFPFFLAETLRLSGIVTILFSGLASKRYAEPNLNESSKKSADSLFRVLAHLAESAIFLELGLSMFGLPRHITHPDFIICAFVACLIGRALNVYPISFAINRTLDKRESVQGPPLANDSELHSSLPELVSMSEDMRVGNSTVHMLWYAGLRGAVAYACAKSFPNDHGHKNDFASTTMWIILITVFFFGSTTDAVLNYLKIEVNVDENSYLAERPVTQDDGILRRLDRYIYPLATQGGSKNIVNGPTSIEMQDLEGEGPDRGTSNLEGFYSGNNDDHSTSDNSSLYDIGGT